MLRFKRRIKIDQMTIGLVMVFLGVFRPAVVSDSIDVEFRIVCILLGMLLLCKYLNIKDYFNLSLFMVIPIILSSMLNYYKNRLALSNMMYGVQHAICIYVLYCTIVAFVKRNRVDKLAEGLCFLSGFYSFISIIMVIILGNVRQYFIGSKFMTGYIMMFYLGIKYYLDEQSIKNNKRAMWRFLFLMIVFEIVVYYMQCMTVFVAIFLMAMLVFLPDKTRKLLSNPWMVTIIIILSMVIMFWLDSIMKSQIMINIVENVLHKSLTLSDRLRYYDRALMVFQRGNRWYGFGYASDEMKSIIGLGSNIQNGLFQILLNYGILGVLGFLVINYISAQKSCTYYSNLWPLYILVLGFYIAASVEVCFNLIFFMSIFLLKWVGESKNQESIEASIQ